MNLVPEASLMTYDYFWLSAKSYIEDNYKGKQKFNWAYPLKYPIANDIHELVEKIVKEKPDIFMVSLYVWNHGLSVKIAEEVKNKIPNCIIIFGGPHLLHKYEEDYFEKNWFVDYLCQSDGYGEVFLNEFLYQIETNQDWDLVPYLVSPKDGRKGFINSPAKFVKRSFEWPRNIFSRNKKYMKSLKKYATKNGNKFYFHYESSRGCPFGCTYCEWGGGINSKVNFKPYEYVKEDFAFIFKYIRPEFFSITDANFGIADRDIDIAKMLCGYNDSISSPQKINMYGPTKVKKENLYEIESMFAKRGMTEEAKIPVQDLNSIVNVNIKRTDDAWESQMSAYQKIKNDHDIAIRLELILGLPGATIESFYETYDVIQDYDVVASRYLWHFLPTAPAANKHYMKQYGIKTMKLSRDSIFNTTFDHSSIIKKDEVFLFNGENNLILDSKYTEPTEIVISTSSYTKYEWVEMWIMDNVYYTMESKNYLGYISKYMKKTKGVPASVFYKKFYRDFMMSSKYLPPKQRLLFKHFIEVFTKKVNADDDVENFYYVDLPDELGIDLKMNINAYMVFTMNLDRNAFYDGIRQWIEDEFGEDDMLRDFMKWVANSIKWLDYDPDANQYFTTKYNWLGWLQDDIELVESNFKHYPQDKTYGSEKKEIQWQKYEMKERLENFLFVLCSDYTSNKHTFDNIRVEECL